MVDVVFPREPALPIVGVVRAFVRTLNQLPVRRSEVLSESEKFGNCHRPRGVDCSYQK
jgi:hypothetical protein